MGKNTVIMCVLSEHPKHAVKCKKKCSPISTLLLANQSGFINECSTGSSFMAVSDIEE